MTFKNLFLLATCFTLTACVDEEQTAPLSHSDQRKEEIGKLFGDDTLSFGNTKNLREGLNGAGVNVYLWRASLDVFSFMDLDIIDPHGGVITTHWYEDPENAHQRIKVTIVIYDDEMRADGLKVSVYRQALKGHSWKNLPTSQKTSHKLEDAVLNRARELKSKKLKDYRS